MNRNLSYTKINRELVYKNKTSINEVVMMSVKASPLNHLDNPMPHANLSILDERPKDAYELRKMLAVKPPFGSKLVDLAKEGK